LMTKSTIYRSLLSILLSSILAKGGILWSCL
jgi:hypothetical protein